MEEGIDADQPETQPGATPEPTAEIEEDQKYEEVLDASLLLEQPGMPTPAEDAAAAAQEEQKEIGGGGGAANALTPSARDRLHGEIKEEDSDDTLKIWTSLKKKTNSPPSPSPPSSPSKLKAIAFCWSSWLRGGRVFFLRGREMGGLVCVGFCDLILMDDYS